MTLPNDMSIKGLGDWAEGAGDPPANNQHINADTVDNRHYSDLQHDWQVDIANSGGGIHAKGISFFSGNDQATTITFPDTGGDYGVIVTSQVALPPSDAYVGAVSFQAVNNTTARIYNSGTSIGKFAWAVFKL